MDVKIRHTQLLRSSKRIQMSDRWNPPPRRRLSDSSEDEQNSVADAKDPIRLGVIPAESLKNF